MFPQILLPLPDTFRLGATDVEDERVILTLEPTTTSALCPRCQQPSQHRHSWYWRSPADLPTFGRAVRLHMHVRRFFCRTADCPQRIFSERVGDALPCSARRTTRHTQALTHITFALGGRPAARLAFTLGFPTSRRTLLRLLLAQPLPERPTPRVLGLDDWAWRKGRSYRTILVDLERHQVVDFLPDRESATVAAWLQTHPGVEIVSRDRAKAYAEGVRLGAPGAGQVIDRWHMLKRMTETIENLLGQKRSALVQATQTLNAVAAATVSAAAIPHAPPSQPSRAGATARATAHRATVARYRRIQKLAAKKVDVAHIARQVGVSRVTVYRYLRMTAPPPLPVQTPRHRSRVQTYKPYLVKRWNEGCRNATQMWREIVELG